MNSLDAPIKPVAMTKKQLAQKYKVCTVTLNAWIKPFADQIGIIKGVKILTPAQVKTIYEKIGEP